MNNVPSPYFNLMYINQNSDGTVELTAPVMVPGAKDCDYKNGEPPLTKEQIREFAKSYEHYGFVDHEHGLTRNGVKIGTPVKSFLLSEPTTMTLMDGSLKSYPAGSWFITAHLTNEDAINTALEGGYTGYSASVFSKNRADQYLAALKNDKDTPLPTACKSISSGGTALIKDVPNPVVLSVSLVKSPCLHDSMFCELNDGETMENQEDVKSLKSKVLSAMGMTDEAEVIALKSEVESLESKIDEMQKEFSDALDSMKEEFNKILTDALTPVKEEEPEEEAEEEPNAEKSEEEQVEEEATEEEVEEDEATEDEEVAEKSEVVEHGESKAEPVHDNLEAQKSKPVNVYEIMGRYSNGVRKRH